jgi:hypothetical protein
MDEVQQAVFNNAGCTQHLPLGKEDCLSLSIYTPSVSVNQSNIVKNRNNSTATSFCFFELTLVN